MRGYRFFRKWWILWCVFEVCSIFWDSLRWLFLWSRWTNAPSPNFFLCDRQSRWKSTLLSKTPSCKHHVSGCAFPANPGGAVTCASCTLVRWPFTCVLHFPSFASSEHHYFVFSLSLFVFDLFLCLTQGTRAKWYEPDIEIKMLHDLTYAWNLKKTREREKHFWMPQSAIYKYILPKLPRSFLQDSSSEVSGGCFHPYWQAFVCSVTNF